MDDIANIKDKLSRHNSDSEYVNVMSNNLAFLKEEFKEKQKQMSNIKEQKEKLLSGAVEIDEDMYDRCVSDDEDSAKKYTTKCHIFEEILETENKFIKDLRFTLEVFDLSTMKNKVSSQDYNLLFEDLNSVIAVAQSFYSELLQAVDKHGFDLCIGSIFLRHVTAFETVYKEYCINYDHKLDILQKKSRSSELEDFIDEGLQKMNQQGTNISSIDSMLVKPLQRFLKYSLFIKTIIQNTNDGHVDMADLKAASIEFDRIALKINEKKRFEEMRTEIFDRTGQWHQKTLHAFKKAPQRLIAASLYGSQQNDDAQYTRVVSIFKNLRKRISIFLQIVVMLRNNLKDVLIIYSSISNSLQYIISSESGSELTQYVAICSNTESNYCKKSILQLENMVIIPLSKLLELFSGPQLLIKKRKSAFLDYVAMKEKMDNKEVTRTQVDRKEVLYKKFMAINNTLKEELSLLIAKSTILFNECICNYMQMSVETTGSIADCLRTLLKNDGHTIEDEDAKCGRMQMNIIAQLQHTMMTIKGADNFYYMGLTSPNRPLEQMNALNRSETYFQTVEDISGLEKKFNEMDLAFVKRDFIPTKAHQLRVETGNMVGILKRCDPKGSSSSWLVEVCQKRIGFVPQSHLDPVTIVNRRQSSETLPRTFKSSTVGRASTLKRVSINLSHFDPNSSSNINQRLSREDVFKEVRTAQFDYKATGSTDISMTKNDRLILIEAHDRTGNIDWSLVANMNTGQQGYVPSNYISPGDQ